MIPSRLTLVAALSLAVLAPAAHAEGLSFNLGAVSLYKSNGVDQDDRSPKAFRPAIQGGVDYAFGNGFYVGNWNSTGKFGDGANLEIDLYGGFSNELSNGVTYDLGVARYIYPNNTADYNANEWYASLGYSIFKVKYTRGFGNGNKNARLGLSVEQPLNDKLTLKAGVGKRNSVNLDGATDFNVGVSYALTDDTSLAASLSGAQKSKVGDAGKTRLILGVTKTF